MGSRGGPGRRVNRQSLSKTRALKGRSAANGRRRPRSCPLHQLAGLLAPAVAAVGVEPVMGNLLLDQQGVDQGVDVPDEGLVDVAHAVGQGKPGDRDLEQQVI